METLEDNAKCLTRDLIKQEKSLDDFARGQLKLLHDLSASSFLTHFDQQTSPSNNDFNIPQLIQEWKQTAQQISEQTNLLNEITNKTIVESSKRLALALSNVSNAIKKREQSLNEFLKLQHKFEKLNEKLSSSTNSLASTNQTTSQQSKLEQIQKQLSEAKQQYELKNQILNQELPILHEQRGALVYPCLEAFIEAQVRFIVELFRDRSKPNRLFFQRHYCDQLETAYRTLIGPSIQLESNSSTVDEINRKLTQIKGLSIVASD